MIQDIVEAVNPHLEIVEDTGGTVHNYIVTDGEKFSMLKIGIKRPTSKNMTDAAAHVRTEARILARPELQCLGYADIIESYNEFNGIPVLQKKFLWGDELPSLVTDPQIAKDLRERVDTLHEVGIAHGDLRGPNVLKNSRLYIIDFGMGTYAGDVVPHEFQRAIEHDKRRLDAMILNV